MLREHVRLKVHGIARFGCAEVRVGKRVRGDPEHHGLAFQIRDGQRDPIDRDGAFADAKPVDLCGQRNLHHMILSVLLQRKDHARAVHMTLHEMPAQPIPHPQRALQIHHGTGGEFSQRSHAQGLREDIESDVRP